MAVLCEDLLRNSQQATLLHVNNNSTYFIDCFLSACLPIAAQLSAATNEADDEAAMLAEFEANFS